MPYICGIHSITCSSVPLARTPAAASEVPTMDRPIPASPQNSSSMLIGKPSPVSSSAWATMKSTE